MSLENRGKAAKCFWSLLCGAFLLGLSPLLTGCGGGGPSLSGKFTVKGQPQKGKTLSFYPGGSAKGAKSATTDDNGNYSWTAANGCVEGKVKITIDAGYTDVDKKYQKPESTTLETTIGKGSTTYDVVVP